jgi:hypothetical protein
MKHNSHEMRRTMRCGSIPTDKHVPDGGWQPETFDLETCAGYTTSLPDVLDVQWAYPHWAEGQLTIACDGEQPPRSLVAGCAVLKGAANDFEAHEMKKRTDKVGG